ncbi:mobile element transfer protein [Streptomyces sp. NPDC094448]|uniref:mobile element transfer protein n=1 Tax=Streptomyces sp. NPDC094448 TaxID=3366063 RepID=UPI0037F7E278
MPRRFRDVRSTGPVHVATFTERGRTRHLAACTAPRCTFSAEYDSRAAAERIHRCPPR